MDDPNGGQIALFIVLGLVLLFVIIALVRAVKIVPQAVAHLVSRDGSDVGAARCRE